VVSFILSQWNRCSGGFTIVLKHRTPLAGGGSSSCQQNKIDGFLLLWSRTKPYDIRDDFNFPIVNFPFICSNIPATPAYGVYISQLTLYSTDFEAEVSVFVVSFILSQWDRCSGGFTIVLKHRTPLARGGPSSCQNKIRWIFDDFNFPIVNFPFICSNIPATPAYGVYISQVTLYSTDRASYQDFIQF
jgi:hypothetical protein